MTREEFLELHPTQLKSTQLKSRTQQQRTQLELVQYVDKSLVGKPNEFQVRGVQMQSFLRAVAQEFFHLLHIAFHPFDFIKKLQARIKVAARLRRG